MSNIRKFRKAAGLTQGELAEKMGTKQPTVAMWETGAAKPRSDKLPALARILGCSIDELFAEPVVDAG